jgi:hypothetical protein
MNKVIRFIRNPAFTGIGLAVLFIVVVDITKPDIGRNSIFSWDKVISIQLKTLEVLKEAHEIQIREHGDKK